MISRTGTFDTFVRTHLTIITRIVNISEVTWNTFTMWWVHSVSRTNFTMITVLRTRITTIVTSDNLDRSDWDIVNGSRRNFSTSFFTSRWVDSSFSTF
jgi:hypothetical protein